MKQISPSSHQNKQKVEDNKGIVRNIVRKRTDNAMAKRKRDKTITSSRHKIAGKNADVALNNNILLTHSHFTNKN